MGLSVYSGTSRLPLIIPFIVIVLRDTLMYTRGENPVPSSDTLKKQVCAPV